MPIIKRDKSTIHGLNSDLIALQAADTAQSQALQAHIDGAFSTAKNLLDVVNGDASTNGSFRKALADVVGTASVAFDTLKEIQDYISVNPDANVAAAITAAIEALKGTVSTSMDTLAEIEAAVNAIQPGIAKLETLTVADDKIVLSFAPKDGLAGISNYARVCYIDGNGSAFEAPVAPDISDSSGKTYIISVNNSGQWDGLGVQVQYTH